MRILVISDSHGHRRAAEEVLYLHSSAKEVIFLGDGLRDIEELEYIFPEHRFHKVAGNGDFFSDEKYTDKIRLAGKLIFFTHGHNYNVKRGLYEFRSAARAAGADIALYGHTHQPYTEYDDGMYIMNPGSVSASGSGVSNYGIIDITDAGIITITAKL